VAKAVRFWVSCLWVKPYRDRELSVFVRFHVTAPFTRLRSTLVADVDTRWHSS
jgi:hypothetical protein